MARRRNLKRFYVPQKARLAISCGVLILIIISIVFVVRGCSARPGTPDLTNQSAEKTTAPTEDPTPGANDLPTQTPDTRVDTDALFETPAPVSTPKPGGRSATIRSIGDIVISDNMLKAASSDTTLGYDFRPMIKLVKDSMAKADYTVINVDGPLGGKGTRGYSGYPQFNTPPHLLDALKEAGVDMLTLSNNHALDTYFDGLKRTIDNVDQAGLDHIGAYRTQEEYDAPYIKEINGIDVGFLNYGTALNTMEKLSDKAAVEYGLRLTRSSNAELDIQSLKAAGAEVVVVYMHWGEEYFQVPEAATKQMAKKLAQYGADVIVGGHPHMVQPVEWITGTDPDGTTRSTLVLYSMGNFLSDHTVEHTDYGIIFEFTLRSNDTTGKIEAVSPKYIPVYVWKNGQKTNEAYRVVAIGDMIDNRPADMDDENYNRMNAALSSLRSLLGSDIVTAQRN